ncbi:hypothetical protein L2475_02390 [Lactobacillus gasseri]|nr:hypothetical protein [Lactobacillus gasseri]
MNENYIKKMMHELDDIIHDDSVKDDPMEEMAKRHLSKEDYEDYKEQVKIGDQLESMERVQKVRLLNALLADDDISFLDILGAMHGKAMQADIIAGVFKGLDKGDSKNE